MTILESTFYRYAKHAVQNMVAQMHGNTSLCKPRPHIIQATAMLQCILDNSADHLSYRSQVLAFEKEVVSKIQPATWKWKETILKVNEVNTLLGLKEVSLPNLSKIHESSFEEYDAKRPQDNFSWCSGCDKYHSLRKLP